MSVTAIRVENMHHSSARTRGWTTLEISSDTHWMLEVHVYYITVVSEYIDGCM